MRRSPVATSTRKRKNVMPPMHQVNRRRMPLLRTFTGCRCRKTLVRTASPRLRGVSGGPCRKIEFQICVVRVKAQSFFKPSILLLRRVLQGPRSARPSSALQERFGVAPLPLLVHVGLRLVDDQLAVLGQDDPVALQRSGSRTLEVHPGAVETAAVARALELGLGLEPVRRAAEVGADRLESLNPLVVP